MSTLAKWFAPMTLGIYDRGFSSSPELGIWKVYITPQGCQNMSVTRAVAGSFCSFASYWLHFSGEKYNRGASDKSTSSNSPSNQIYTW